MSLIVFVSTDAGIVIVGDRAQTASTIPIGSEIQLVGGATSSAPKVFAFDNQTVFGVTGLPRIDLGRDDGTIVPGFDATKAMLGYSKGNPYAPDDADFWNGMIDGVTTEMMAKAPPGHTWKPSHDGFIFQAMFAHVPTDESKWSFRCFRLSVAVKGDEVSFMPEIVPHPMPSVRAIGNDLVYLEVMGGSDPRFDDVRADPIVQTIKKRPLTHPEAVIFAKRMCAITSQRRLLLEARDSGHNVSAETDGWIVTAGGWQRLHKNSL